jgi:hypothetical protein
LRPTIRSNGLEQAFRGLAAGARTHGLRSGMRGLPNGAGHIRRGRTAPDVEGLTLVDRQRHEARTVFVFNLEQGCLAAILGGGVDDADHIGGIGHVLVVDRDDHVAGAQSAILSGAVGRNRGDQKTLPVSAGTTVRPKVSSVASACGTLGAVSSSGLSAATFGRQGAEFDLDRFALAIAPDSDLDGLARIHGGDLLGEITRILNRVAIDRGDHVTGLDARLGCGSVVLRRGDQRALGFGKTQAIRRCRR